MQQCILKEMQVLCECVYPESRTHSVRAKKIIFIFKGIFPLDEGIFTVAFSFHFSVTLCVVSVMLQFLLTLFLKKSEYYCYVTF